MRISASIPVTKIAAGSTTYKRGFHRGDPGGLVAVDADLVTGNIKSGKTLFSVGGHTNVRDVSDADAVAGEIKTGSTFYAVGGAKKTGSGTKTLSPANENVEAGYYAATTLSAVDEHLAAENILKDVNIFGKVGTVEEKVALTSALLASAYDILASVTNEWVNVASVSIGDDEEEIVMVLVATCEAGAAAAELEGLYNSVQKFFRSEVIPVGRMEYSKWNGDGLGIVADGIVRLRTTSSDNLRGSGVIYGIKG